MQTQSLLAQAGLDLVQQGLTEGVSLCLLRCWPYSIRGTDHLTQLRQVSC